MYRNRAKILQIVIAAAFAIMLIRLFASGSLWAAADQFLSIVAMISAAIAIFNLIPIPPLDGSRILTAFLPGKLAFWFQRYGTVMQIVLIAMVFLGSASRFIVIGQQFILDFCVRLCLRAFAALGVV